MTNEAVYKWLDDAKGCQWHLDDAANGNRGRDLMIWGHKETALIGLFLKLTDKGNLEIGRYKVLSRDEIARSPEGVAEYGSFDAALNSLLRIKEFGFIMDFIRFPAT